MLDVHARHLSIHTWKDFLMHIATITIGLLIAVGLEQSVEVLHHRHQREQLEEQMRGVFETNLRRSERTFKQLKAQHAYLVQLRTAISARLKGQPAMAAPPANDERMAAFPTFPSLAPYEAAKENGTVERNFRRHRYSGPCMDMDPTVPRRKRIKLVQRCCCSKPVQTRER